MSSPSTDRAVRRASIALLPPPVTSGLPMPTAATVPVTTQQALVAPSSPGSAVALQMPPIPATLLPIPRDNAWDVAARGVSIAMGTPYAFFLAASSVIVWAAVGKAMGFDNTWLMVMSTGASIAAYLMVFVVQTSQNRDNALTEAHLRRLEARCENLEQKLTRALELLENSPR